MDLYITLLYTQDILMVIACAISIFFYINKKTFAHLLLMILLIILVLIHLPYYIPIPVTIKKGFDIFYDLFAPMMVGIYILIYRNLITSCTVKRIITFLFSVVCILTFLNLCVSDSSYLFTSSHVIFLTSAFTIVCIFLFLYQLFQNTQTKNLFRNFWLWISLGLFVFLAGETPVMSALDYYQQNLAETSSSFNILFYVKLILGSLYYSTFIITLFLCNPKK